MSDKGKGKATVQNPVQETTTVKSGSSSNIATTIIHVDGNPYLLHAEHVATLEQSFPNCEFLPATYFGDDVTAEPGAAVDILASLAVDDVWSLGFMALAIYPSYDVKGKQPAGPESSDTPVIHVRGGLDIPPGPYAVHAATGNVYPVSRLMPDPSNAFVRGIVPNSYKVPFRWLEASDLIPVPSRIYSGKPTRKGPLSGLRFGVKDNIDISGLQTGNGSKDYRALYPPRGETAPCIQHLLNSGAVLVGKLRCTQWCDGQDPLERLEEVTPTNPRGDGWQKPSSSSSGSASACASYPWLDFTVGSDTGGSIRHPAGVNGLFGIRSSLDAIDSSLALVCSPEFDTIGIFTRSASMASTVSKVMLDGAEWRLAEEVQVLAGEEKKRSKFKLLYAVEPASATPTAAPKFFPHPTADPIESQIPAADIFEIFLTRLEAHLNVQREAIDLYDHWRTTRPDPESTDADLARYTAGIYPNLVYGAMARDVLPPFVADFQRQRPGGARPFIEPTTKARLEYGAGVSDEEMERSSDALDVFATWINTVLLPAPAGRWMRDEDGDEIPLLVYPQSWGVPQYRDDVSRREPGKLFWEGFSVYSLSYGSGCPDYVLPLGEVEFTSRITGAAAHLPVAVSLLVPNGMDEALLGLIRELEEVGVLREVASGDRLFRESAA